MRPRVFSTIALLAATLILLQAGTSSDKEKQQPGKSLLTKHQCFTCHFLQGKGKFVGPPFEEIGRNRSQEYLEKILLKSREPEAGSDQRDFIELFREHPILNRADAREISQYLSSLGDEAGVLSVQSHGGGEYKTKGKMAPEFKYTPEPPSRSSRNGARLYRESGCAACHSIGGAGSRLAPALDGIGAWRSRGYMKRRIGKGAVVVFSRGDKTVREYTMPGHDIPDQDARAIVDFLMTLPVRQ